MRNELLDHLACPSCGGDFSLHAESVDGDHVISGTLTCENCARLYAVTDGVPRLNTEMSGLERVAQTFGYEWKQHHAGKLEDETVFGLTREQDWAYFVEATGLSADDLRDDVVLDAGCGSGRLTSQMAEAGASAAIGMDINEAVDEAFAAWRHLPNLHVVQGNVFAPPFKKRNFDLVWSNGVIHHTPDAEGAHRSLTSLVKPGGILYVWVYAKRFNPFRFTKDVLDTLRVTSLPEPVLLRISNGFAYASVGMLRGYQLVRKLPGLQPKSTHARRTVRNRTVDELKLTWFDALSPEFDSRHSEAEVIGWFENAGFREIHAIEEPKVGVRGVAPQATGS